MDNKSGYAMESYSAVKWNEVLVHAAAQMNLENIVLNEVSQLQMTTYHMICMKAQSREI